MNPLWNSGEGRLRTPWRLILQAALMVALGLAPIALVAEPLTALYHRRLFLSSLGPEAYDRVINMIVGPLLAAAVIGSVAIAGRRLDHRRFEEFGARLDRAWWTSLALGLVLGGALMGLVFAVEYTMSWIVVTGSWVTNAAGVSLALALAFSLVKAICVGTYEEFLSRGYHLRNLAEGTSLPVAVVLSSAVFAFLHAWNENATAMSTAGLFANGLLLAAGALATGRLSSAIGLHIAWNLCEGSVFGFPVSGDKEGASVVALRQLGPPLVTGGEFGPEAGLIGIAASLLGIAVFQAWGRWCRGVRAGPERP
jgi:membrane protease YdiL (CAAX protease family)